MSASTTSERHLLAPARALVAALLVLLAARAALAFAPGMAWWGLDSLRFAPPPVGWAAWGAAMLALVAATSGAGTPALARLEAAATARGRWVVAGLALATAAAAWSLPDRFEFLGDSLLRRAVAAGRAAIDLLSPGGPGQLLPLDRWLHVDLPRFAAGSGPAGADMAARALGAIEAALLVLLGAAWAAQLRCRGAAALVVILIVAWGGWLGVFTGYGKSTQEMCLLVAAVGLLSLRLLREGRGALGLGVALGLGLLLHRSALALVPVTAWTAWAAARTAGAARARAARAAAALAPPALALAWVLPRVLGTLRGYDLGGRGAANAHLHAFAWAAPGVGRVRTLDVLDVILLLCPLAPLALAALPWRRPTSPSADPARALPTAWALLFLGPQLAMLALLDPHQGRFRDWDVFAPSGVALALVVSAVLARAVARARAREWLVVACALATLGPTWDLLATAHDEPSAAARLHAFLHEQPARPGEELALAWDFLGGHAYDRHAYGEAARAYRTSAAFEPNPRVLWAWARAANRAGDPREARRADSLLVRRNPSDPVGWTELSRVELQLGDVDAARAAARQLARLEPGDPWVRANLARLDSLAAAHARR